MKHEVRLSKEALDNIEATADYIRTEYADSHAAEQYVERVFNTIKSLGDFPRRVKLTSPELGNSCGLRYLTSGNQAIIFQILEDNTVWIDAVWYSGRDVMTKLRNIEHSGLFIADYDKITNNEINFETILQELAEQEKEKDRDDFTL